MAFFEESYYYTGEEVCIYIFSQKSVAAQVDLADRLQAWYWRWIVPGPNGDRLRRAARVSDRMSSMRFLGATANNWNPADQD